MSTPTSPSGRPSVPLSFNQERELYRRWWSSIHGYPEIVMNMAIHFEFGQRANMDAIRRALDEITLRHDSLRTSFDFNGSPLFWRAVAPIGILALKSRAIRRMLARLIADPSKAGRHAYGPFRASIIPAASIPVSEFDATKRSAEPGDAMKVFMSSVHSPIDPATAPLSRALLIRGAAGRDTLVVVVHHLIFDWTSETVFRSEFDALYAAFAKGETCALPAPSMQHSEFIVWERTRFAGPYLERCLRYWNLQLPDFSTFLTPVRAGELQYAKPASPRKRMARTQELTFDASRRKLISDCCIRNGVTPYMVLLSALAFVLHRASGRAAIVLWMPFANRLASKTEGMIGWVEQTLPVRLDFGDSPDEKQILRRARDTVLGAMDNQMPIPLLVAHQGVDLPRDDNLATDHICFDFRTDRRTWDRPADGRARREFPSPFALHLTGVESPEALSLIAQYSVDWFTDDAVCAMLGDVDVQVSRLIAPATASSDVRPT